MDDIESKMAELEVELNQLLIKKELIESDLEGVNSNINTVLLRINRVKKINLILNSSDTAIENNINSVDDKELTKTELKILEVLAIPLTIQEIHDTTKISMNTLNVKVNGLKEKGIIIRLPKEKGKSFKFAKSE